MLQKITPGSIAGEKTGRLALAIPKPNAYWGIKAQGAGSLHPSLKGYSLNYFSLDLILHFQYKQPTAFLHNLSVPAIP
jgi:hypothetical protein